MMASTTQVPIKNNSYLFLCGWFCKEPKFLFKTAFFSLAFTLAIYQLCICSMKLLIPNDTTSLFIQINQTLHYPAVTFCRQPPFANLDADIPVPDIVKVWEEIDTVKNITFVDFLIDVAFSPKEVDSVRLGAEIQEMKVLASFTYMHGQCYTYTPQTPVNRVGKYFGYNISLTYDRDFPKDDVPYGWHIYVHDPQHAFHDHCTTDGRADYYFLNVGEIVEAKIKPKQFTRKRDCEDEKTVAECFQSCVYRKLVKKLECQAPWMNFEGVDLCHYDDDSFSYMLYFGSPNNSFISEQTCSCPRVCSFTNYEIFVEKVTKGSVFSPKRSHLSIYYTTNAITVAREINSYDSSTFLADISATLAFSLGLSILSIGVILEKVCRIIFWPKPSIQDESRRPSEKLQHTLFPSPASSQETLTTSIEDCSIASK